MEFEKEIRRIEKILNAEDESRLDDMSKYSKRFYDNSKLVYYVLNKLMGNRYYSLDNFSKQDAVQEGNILLWKACYDFDKSKDCKFSTYAVNTIHQGLKNFFNQDIYNNGNLSLHEVREISRLKTKKEDNSDGFDYEDNCKLASLNNLASTEYEKREELSSFNNIDIDMKLMRDDLTNILSYDEKVLLNLLKTDTSINDISEKLRIDRTTVWRRKNKLEERIKKYLYE